MHWCATRGLKACPLDIVGYGDEEEIGDTEVNQSEDGAAPWRTDAHDQDDNGS